MFVDECGDYKFGFKCFNGLGNEHTGTLGEAESVDLPKRYAVEIYFEANYMTN